jgi:hypothetical protein
LTPTTLNATAIGCTEIDLTWNNGADPQTTITIERSSDGVSYVSIASVSGTSTAFQDTVLMPSSSYDYRVLAFNGSTPSAAYSNVSTATTGTPSWTPLAPGGPPPPALVSMGSTNVLVGNQMFVCQGDDGNLPPASSTYALQYSGGGSPSWSSQGLGPTPGVRISPGVAYDPVNQAVILMGGEDTSTPIPVFNNDVWKLTQTSPGTWTWAPVLTTVNKPPGRFGHATVFSGSKLYVIGGNTGATVVNDVWSLDFSSPTPAWQQIYANSPMTPRWNLTAVVDTFNNQIVIFGGSDTSSFRNDTWTINLTGTPSMLPILAGTTPPSGRDKMTAVYDSSAAMMIVFGGDSALGCENDVWILSLSGIPTWTPVLVTGTPPGIRAGYAAVFDDTSRRFLLFGGLDFNGVNFYSDVWKLQF